VRFVVLALLVLAACGTGSDGEEAAAGTLSLSVDHGELVAGDVPTFHLTVRNGTGDDVVLTFASGQSGDVVLSQGGDERWRWSAGLAFTQAIREEPLPAGAEATYELSGSPLAVPPGDYTLEATLTSDPAPPPVQTEANVR
jgi:hypothetical protein